MLQTLVSQVKQLTETNNRLDIENRNLLREMQERDEKMKTVDDELSAIKAEFVRVFSYLC